METVRAITSKKFWQDFWDSKKDSFRKIISEKYLYADILEKYLPKGPRYKILEIGGFPGFYSVFFTKYFGYDATLIDYYVDRKVIEALCQANRLQQDISIIEADIFDYEGKREFDIVFSTGFVEHFENTEAVIQKHISLVKSGGYVVIGLPNFRGLNGFIQFFFDRGNFTAHNLNSMKIDNLRCIFQKHGMTVLYAGYYGRFGIWLEGIIKRNAFIRYSFRLMNIIGDRFVKSESRVFSQFIIVIGQKTDKPIPCWQN